MLSESTLFDLKSRKYSENFKKVLMIMNKKIILFKKVFFKEKTQFSVLNFGAIFQLKRAQSVVRLGN